MKQSWNAYCKLVTIVLNHSFSFDCCVVPPEAWASYEQELDETVDALMPMFVGQDQLEHVSIKRMRWAHTLLRSPMACLTQNLAVAPSVAKSTGLRAARDAQDKLTRMELTMDERAMPRGTDAPGWELDVARVWARPRRKRQESWKQPLSEAATRCEPLKSHAARLTQTGGDENALWLTVNEGPECTPLDDLEFRINARMRLDLPVVQGGLCQHQRRQKPDGTVGAKCLVHLDEHGQHAQKCLIGGDRAKLHDVRCHIIRSACCAAGLKSQREVIVPTLATEKLTEPWVDVDAWEHPGPPHIRLGKANGGVGVTAISPQLNGRFGPGIDMLLRKLAGYKRAINEAAGRDGGRPLQEWQQLLSTALARYTAATVLSATGHKALRRHVVRTSPVSFICTVRDRTTPCEHRVKDRDREREKKESTKESTKEESERERGLENQLKTMQ